MRVNLYLAGPLGEELVRLARDRNLAVPGVVREILEDALGLKGSQTPLGNLEVRVQDLELIVAKLRERAHI